MIIRSIVAATLVLVSSLVFGQACTSAPGSICLVPARTASCPQATCPQATCPQTTNCTTCPTTSSTVIPYNTATTAAPACGCLTSLTPVMGACSNINSDTACLMSQISALRTEIRSLQGTLRAAALVSRGQPLITRMNSLMAEEAIFRQQLAANPNLPGAQAMALALTAQAQNLNREIAGFNRELSLIPADQRPYIAPDLTTFTTAYWEPAIARFTDYRSNVAQSGMTYQPAFAANPWLQPWLTGYQTELSNISGDQQQYASLNWWGNMRVAGSTEVYPGGTMTSQNGTVYFIPAGTILVPMSTTTVGVVGATR